MLQCTALQSLPIYAACELGEGHAGEHADHMRETDHPDEAMWVVWTGDGHRILTLAWCTAMRIDDGTDEACGLYAGHPLAHSWDVSDPTIEALAEHIAARGFPRGL